MERGLVLSRGPGCKHVQLLDVGARGDAGLNAVGHEPFEDLEKSQTYASRCLGFKRSKAPEAKRINFLDNRNHIWG